MRCADRHRPGRVRHRPSKEYEMSEFLLAIVLKTGEVLCNPLTDSYTVLIDHYGQAYPVLHQDNADRANFIRVEFTPPSCDAIDKPELYQLRVDENFTPGWFDDEMRESAI